MNVSDLQKFFSSLSELFTATKTTQNDLYSINQALEPFNTLSLADFATFMQQAKEYKETGILPVLEKKKGSGSKSKTPKPKAKTPADKDAIQQAVDELEKMYSHVADEEVTYAIIEAKVQEIADTFNVPALKEVAKGFNLTAGLKSKKVVQEKIGHKLKERKSRIERGRSIEDAATATEVNEGPQPEVAEEAQPAEAEEVVEAIVVD